MTNGGQSASMTERTILDYSAGDVQLHAGLWTYSLSTLTGFTVNAKYIAFFISAADVALQWREFQFGGAESDQAVIASGLQSVNVNQFTNGSINLNAFTAQTLGVVGMKWLESTATTSPVTASFYGPNPAGPDFNGKIAFAAFSGSTYFIWWDSSNSVWTVSSTVGSQGANYWTSSTLLGTYTGHGVGTTGAPSFTAFGLPVSDFLPNMLIDSSGQVTSNAVNGNVTGSVASVTGAVGSVTGAVGSVTGSVGSISGVSFPTNFSSTSIDGSGRVLLQPTQTGVTIPTVTTVGTVSGNVNGNLGGNVVGTVGSVTGAVGSVTGSVGSVAGSVAGDVSGKILGGGASSITGSGVQATSVVGAVGSVTGSVGSVTGAVGSVTGNVGGDVGGKVLGGGSSTITGDGVRAASVTGAVGAVTGAVGSVTGSVGSVTGSVGSVVGAVGSVAGSVGSVTGAVGSVTGSVGSVANSVAQTGDVGNLIPTRIVMTGGKPWVLDDNGNSLLTTIPNVLFVDGTGNKLKVNTDHTVNATAVVDTSGIATAVANVLFVDGATNPLKVNTDHSVNASVSGGITVNNYYTVPPEIVQASLIPSQVPCLRGDTLNVVLPLLGSLTGWSKILFTVKQYAGDADSAAMIQVEALAAGGGGLLTLLGATAPDASNGVLTVVNATTGQVSITLAAAVTAQFPIQKWFWDCEAIFSSGLVATPIFGQFNVIMDITQATS